mmetsp:Transcript_57481/g.126217  ORF Transcript_57481/g.126217 Transcript_57481/m.126217 type:complete len:232 (-) Transcript_57481:894-1589(-)
MFSLSLPVSLILRNPFDLGDHLVHVHLASGDGDHACPLLNLNAHILLLLKSPDVAVFWAPKFVNRDHRELPAVALAHPNFQHMARFLRNCRFPEDRDLVAAAAQRRVHALHGVVLLEAPQVAFRIAAQDESGICCWNVELQCHHRVKIGRHFFGAFACPLVLFLLSLPVVLIAERARDCELLALLLQMLVQVLDGLAAMLALHTLLLPLLVLALAQREAWGGAPGLTGGSG